MTVGKLDIAVNGRGMKDSGIYQGRGDGTFSGPIYLTAGGGGWGIDLGDFTGDGKIDIAVGDHLDGAKSWANLGAGAFAASRNGLPQGFYSGAGLADLNGDGNLDLLLGADQFHSGFHLAFGDGKGNWTQKSPRGLPTYTNHRPGAATNVGYISFADFDCDGNLDIFAFGQAPSTGNLVAFVFRNGGDGLSWIAVPGPSAPIGGLLGSPV